MKDVIVKGFEYTNNRTVMLSDVINSNTVAAVKKDFLDIINKDLAIFNDNYTELSIINKEVAIAYARTIEFPPIYFDINCPGGCVYDGLAIYDFIREISMKGKHTIIAKLNGSVASMASVVMLACNQRIAGKNTSFLIHSISSIECGKFMDLVDSVEEIKRLTTILHKIYIENTNLTEDELEEIDKLKKDRWIDPVEALKLGLITKIN